MTEPAENFSIPDRLAQRFLTHHLGEATSYLESLSPDDAAAALQSVPPESIAPVWEYLSTGFGSLVFPLLSADRQIALLEGLDRSVAARMVATMRDGEREETLARLDDGAADEIRLLLSYPEDTAGRLMDTHIFALHGSVTAGRAVEMVRQRGRGEAISIKAIDAENRLIGLVDLRDIAFSDSEKPISELTMGVAAVVSAMDSRSAVVEKFQEFDLQEMPVIDMDGRVLGVIRHNQLLDALRTDASLDIQTMVGASRDERALSTSWFAIRKRLPWLQINLLTAFLAASVVGIFEATIATYTALAILLPVVAGQSGNAGAQALAVTMRAIALREIHFGQWFRVMRKEINTGLWNGIGIAVTCSIGVYFWSGNVGLVIVIAASMVISMIAAGIAGALVPITLSRLGQDPAVASSIILTTVTDIAGFFSFLGIATLLSGLLGPGG